ncbi:MAG: G5 domain-containing protein, partial [Alicyclobacillus sp.]|nr:G5 domain-containing protein [Alicyclobacillus sp.]
MHETPAWQRAYVGGQYIGMVPDRPVVVGSMVRVAKGYHVPLRLEPIHTRMPAGYSWHRVAELPTPAAAIVRNGTPLVYTQDQAAAAKVLAAVRRALTPDGLSRNAHVTFQGRVAVRSVVVGAARIVSPSAAVRLLLHPAPALSGRHGGLHFISANSTAASHGLRRAEPGAVTGTSGGAGVTASAVSAGERTGGTGLADSADSRGASPLLSVVAEQTVTRTVNIPAPVRYIDDNRLPVSATSVVQPGHPGQAREQVKQTYVNGRLVRQRVVHRVTVDPPQPEVVR